MYIGHIELQNWKNFKDARANLARRVFLVGPNASGKSNLLDALRFLRDVARDGLRSAVDDIRDGVSSLRCLAARASSGIAIEVVLRDDEDVDVWRYRIEFNQDSSRVPRLKRELVENLRTGQTIVDRPNEADKEDSVLLTQTALEQIIANREFREVADFFNSISYHHLVPQVVRDPKNFSPAPIQNDPFGRDLLLRIRNTPKATRNAWLKRISSVLSQAVPQLKDLEVEDDQGTPHLVGRYEHWRLHDAKQNESQFSDGTLRLFGLMWSMFEGTGPLLLEEPELSLHPEIVREIPQMFVQLQNAIRKMKKRQEHSARQIVISTHSDDLLNDKGIAGEETLRIVPGKEGSLLQEADENDRVLLRSGLTVADVILPKTAPFSGQLQFSF